MSIVPRDSIYDDGDRALTSIWDRLLARHNAFFSNSPLSSAFPFQFPFPSPFSSSRTVPYSELSIESQGSVATRLECREIEEALLFVADLPSGVDKDDVGVEAGQEQGVADGGALRISGGGGAGSFSWKFRLPPTAKLHLMNYSVENGVLTVIVPKVVAWDDMAVVPPRSRDVRVVEIEGGDD